MVHILFRYLLVGLGIAKPKRECELALGCGYCDVEADGTSALTVNVLAVENDLGGDFTVEIGSVAVDMLREYVNKLQSALFGIDSFAESKRGELS